MMRLFFLLFLLISGFNMWSQADTTIVEDDEDYSMYDNLEFVDEGAKRFCTSKVLDLSPAKLISFGYDFQSSTLLSAGEFYDSQNEVNYLAKDQKVDYSGGLRFAANIPVISRNNIIIQLGANFQQNTYSTSAEPDITSAPLGSYNPMTEIVNNRSLTSMGLNTTIFKPFNEKYFLVAQASQDWNGDYAVGNFDDMHMPTFSAAVIFGSKTSDRKQLGFGLSRTYRGGELLYIPVMLLNWTAPSRKWGVEVLAPAKAHYRRTFSSRSILMLGYELEGNSYFIGSPDYFKERNSTFLLRRSELRFRAIYERSLKGFIWVSLQAGYRYNYRYNLDELADGQDFFRGFTGDQVYAADNKLSGAFYSMITINLVSP